MIALFAFAYRSMKNHVVAVLLRCSPGKIVNVIVRLASVQMPALHPVWAWTYKRCEYERVHKYLTLFHIVTKRDNVVSSLACHWSNTLGIYPRSVSKPLTARVNRQDGSRLINSVTWEFSDYTKSNGNGIIGIRHCLAPYSRWC